LGRHAEALKLDEETLAARKRVLPPDHPDTLLSMTNLVKRYWALDRHPEALKLGEETLAARKRVLGADHPSTLLSMNNLAIIHADLGRHPEALKLHEETLAARKRALPADHADTLVSMWGVAESLVKLNRGAEALPIIDECVARAAGKVVDPQLIPELMDLRLRHFQKANDPAGCRATAAMWEKLDRRDAASLYNAARFRAVTAAVQAKASRADAEPLASEDADKAMEWLTKAIGAGGKDRAQVEKDADLDALRERADFKKLLSELETARQP
jgi:tetratricopeptide (TPR) repeat protein